MLFLYLLIMTFIHVATCLVNPWCACAVLTVLGLCVCLCVCLMGVFSMTVFLWQHLLSCSIFILQHTQSRLPHSSLKPLKRTMGGSRKTPDVRAKRLKKRKSNAFISIFRQTFVETLKKAQVQPICKYEVLILK